MKKLILTAIMILSLSFATVSCSSDSNESDPTIIEYGYNMVIPVPEINQSYQVNSSGVLNEMVYCWFRNVDQKIYLDVNGVPQEIESVGTYYYSTNPNNGTIYLVKIKNSNSTYNYLILFNFAITTADPRTKFGFDDVIEDLNGNNVIDYSDIWAGFKPLELH